MTTVVISGTPGSGKSSLSRLLAEQDSQGVHLHSDDFFAYLSHRIDPSLPESKAQNTAVARAYLAAAIEYDKGGYQVNLDGVIGPWWFELMTTMLGEFDYLLLHAPLALTLERIRDRVGQASARPSVATRMHAQFSAIAAEYSGHLIDTDSLTLDEVAARFRRKRDNGELRISAAADADRR